MIVFTEINDFEYYILPEGEYSMTSDFENLINKYFDFEKNEDDEWIKNNDDLIICLIEMVTLNDNNAIGKTLIRSKFHKKAVENYVKKYEAVVDKIKSNPKLVDGISQYKEWYSRNSYFFFYENENSDYNDQSVSDWRTPSQIQGAKDRDRKLYADLEEKLTEEDILKYLNYYSEAVLEDLNFKEYPYVCLIVKPISVSNGEEYLALGNLYMHFATKKPKSKYFYIKLVNDYMRVWFRENGYDVITEISKYSVQEAEKMLLSQKMDKDYLPNFIEKKSQKLSRLDLYNQKCIEDYYTNLFLDKDQLEIFEEKLFRIAEETILTFFEMIKKKNSNRFSINNIKTMLSVKSLEALRKEENMEIFKDLLVFREVYKIGLLLFNLEPKIFLEALKTGYYKKDGAMPDVGRTSSAYNYLWSNRFIPFKQDSHYKGIESVRPDIENTLSTKEKGYLVRYKEILTRYSNIDA